MLQDQLMLSVRVGCEFTWKSEVPTAAVMQVEPRSEGDVVVIHEGWSSVPEVASRVYRDGFGNHCRRLTLPAGELSVRYQADAKVPESEDHADVNAPERAPAELPDDALVFTLPSRFCESDLLADEAWRLFGSIPPGYRRVEQICDFVHDRVTWAAGTTTSATTAVEVYDSRLGVCRDFTHLAISLCRALNIPARYAFGYLPDIGVDPPDAPMDFCAWMEVFLGDQWYTFDPRNNARRAGRVLIGRGRDALDVAMFTTFGGPHLLEMVVWADALTGDPQ